MSEFRNDSEHSVPRHVHFYVTRVHSSMLGSCCALRTPLLLLQHSRKKEVVQNKGRSRVTDSLSLTLPSRLSCLLAKERSTHRTFCYRLSREITAPSERPLTTQLGWCRCAPAACSRSLVATPHGAHTDRMATFRCRRSSPCNRKIKAKAAEAVAHGSSPCPP